VRRTAIRIGGTVFFATALLFGLVIAFPGNRDVFIGVYELVLGGIAVAVLVGSLQTLRPQRWERSPFDHRPEKPGPPAAVGELERIDRLVVLGCGNAFDLHFRLRPLLRDLARERLHARYGIELDRDPERARPLLGDDLWELVRPERELGRRSGPGVPQPVLAQVVDRLEAL
jgi:hypothetical protein